MAEAMKQTVASMLKGIERYVIVHNLKIHISNAKNISLDIIRKIWKR